jgi:anti-sigma-K factor RskA
MSEKRDEDRTDLSVLSGSFALNALDPADETAFEAHLAVSEDARDEVTELSDTAVLLGKAVAPIAPPASLKASIMAQLDATPQDSVAPSLTALPAAASRPGSAAARAERRWYTSPMATLAGAAAVVALIVGGNVLVGSFNPGVHQVQGDQLAAITAAVDSHRRAAQITGGGSATLVWSNEMGRSALIVDGLPPLPADKTYELWYIDSAGERPAGTLSVADAGSTWQVLDGAMKVGDTVGVTVEPAGGSPAPTTTPIVTIASALAGLGRAHRMLQ